MAKHKVKKGLEKPLRIQGMYLKFFYTWCVMGGVFIVIVVAQIMAFTRPNSGVSAGGFILTLLILSAIFLGSKIYLVGKSKPKKYKESPSSVTLSNVDLTDALKQK